MPISYELASCVSLLFPGVQHRVSQYVLTLRQLSKKADATQGQLAKDAAASSGATVYVVSDIYFSPTAGSGSINFLWQARYYRMDFDMPTKVGREKAYIATRLVSISPTEAMGRAHDEHQATNRSENHANALSAATAAPRSNGMPADYGNAPSNGLPANYGNRPS